MAEFEAIAKIKQILNLLEQEYGPRHLKLEEPISVLVRTILSQNTSDANSHRAFLKLISTFNTWEEILKASTDQIAEAIKSGGLSRIKAQRIKKTLQEILQKRGSLELDFLKELPLPEARTWLRQLPGVGAKTAACVLLFSLGRPTLPVDTHVFRIARRLGLVEQISMEKAQELLESLVPSDKVYQFHIYLIEHGRKVCRAQRPRCPQCVLKSLCPSAE